jgi:hypothetical protein
MIATSAPVGGHSTPQIVMGRSLRRRPLSVPKAWRPAEETKPQQLSHTLVECAVDHRDTHAEWHRVIREREHGPAEHDDKIGRPTDPEARQTQRRIVVGEDGFRHWK